MTTLPRAILFDLDGTILSYQDRHKQLLEIAEEFEGALGPLLPSDLAKAVEAQFEIFWADTWARRHKDWNTKLRDARREVFTKAFQSFQNAPGDLADRLADRFNDRREREMYFFPDAAETIDALRNQGVLLALITNGSSECQRYKINQFDLARRFDNIQVEEEFGAGKPEEIVYRNAIRILGVTPQETWMVGDHLEFDVAAPQRLGIHGVWHDPIGQGVPANAASQPNRVIRLLNELLPP